MTTELTVLCPECGFKMGKAGSAQSGRKKVQNWGCYRCGRRTITTPQGLIPFVRKSEK